MPTGYTAGILDGDITDFKQFAKLCTKAFMFHTRDEPFDSEYKDQAPSDYHKDEIEAAEKKIKDISLLSDAEVARSEIKRLLDDRKHHEENIVQDEKNRVKLEAFLKKAELYVSPTEAHNEISKFMREQIESTIKADCISTYHIDAIKTIDFALLNVNANSVREDVISASKKDVEYHTEEHKKEVVRCRQNNKWYYDFIEALN